MGRPLKLQGTFRLPPMPKRGTEVLGWARRVNQCLKDLSQAHVKAPAPRVRKTSHPWKVTDNSDGTVSVEAGFIFETIASRTPSAGQLGTDLVMNPLEYAGTDSLSITAGTRYIYAKVGVELPGASVYESTSTPDVSGSAASNSTTFAVDFVTTPSITVVESASDPSSVGASGGGYFIVPIAKVTRSGDITTVDKQYLTHNPMLQLSGHEIQ